MEPKGIPDWEDGPIGVGDSPTGLGKARSVPMMEMASTSQLVERFSGFMAEGTVVDALKAKIEKKNNGPSYMQATGTNK